MVVMISTEDEKGDEKQLIKFAWPNVSCYLDNHVLLCLQMIKENDRRDNVF